DGDALAVDPACRKVEENIDHALQPQPLQWLGQRRADAFQHLHFGEDRIETIGPHKRVVAEEIPSPKGGEAQGEGLRLLRETTKVRTPPTLPLPLRGRKRHLPRLRGFKTAAEALDALHDFP